MPDIEYKRRFGDRKEGRQLRSLSPFLRIIPYIMVQRSDACNAFNDSIEISEADRYLRLKRTEGYKGMGFLHLLLAAYVRMIASCPGINRFIGGQRIFARNNIEIIMAVKRKVSSESSATMIKVCFEPTDTIFDIYRKLNEKVDEIKADDSGNGTEKAAALLFKIPGLLLKFAMWLIRLLDYFGWLPQKLLEVSPFHGSMIVTDIGSLGLPPIYHHLYNFGNLPVFLSFGAKRRSYEMTAEGTVAERKYIDYTAVLDERICDGSYYAACFKYLKYYLKNPQLLETPPEKVETDVF